MSTDKVRIDIETKSDLTGAQKAEKSLESLKKTAQGSSAEISKSAKEAANKTAAFGNALRSLVRGDAHGAMSSLQGLGTKFKSLGGVAAAASAAIAVWAANLRNWMGAINRDKKLAIEDSIANAASSAEMLANNFERAATAIRSTSEQEKGMRSLFEATRDLTLEIERQNISNARARELATATNDLQTEEINIKYDRQLADVERRGRAASMEDEKAAAEQERRDLERENQMLREQIRGDKRQMGVHQRAVQGLGELAERQMSWKPWVSGRGITPGARREGIAEANATLAQQTAELSKIDDIIKSSKSKLGKIKENEARISQIKQMESATAPLRKTLENARVEATDISLGARADVVAKTHQAQADEDARVAAALSEAQARRAALTEDRARLLDATAPAEARASDAAKAASAASARLLQAEGMWMGSRNTIMRDKSLAPLREDAQSAQAAAISAEQSLQRTIKTTTEAVKAVDATLKELDREIAKLASRQSAGRVDVQ